MLQEDQHKTNMTNRSIGYALKRRNDRFVVEAIVGIVNPAYEPDLEGDISTISGINRTWRVHFIDYLHNNQQCLRDRQVCSFGGCSYINDPMAADTCRK
ncbi:uncharacterized protein LOC123038147 [Drosophila rhopaloa]|uniref:Uncharacterized protein n=1 Tax=Drosophila rhopaloa TaxID=1041015 RepID=A0ABM5JGK3_DRORH|nr:uncharacterized protein LOC123038147 [Drosophila rhopaloa]